LRVRSENSGTITPARRSIAGREFMMQKKDISDHVAAVGADHLADHE
jgi:hypothetical protein